MLSHSAPLSMAAVILSGFLFSISAAFARPALSLYITSPQLVEGVENLKLITTVNNTGNEILKLLNDPRSPLNVMPTNKFIIQNAAGQRPSFLGTTVMYVPAKAAVLEDDEVFTVLAPGEAVNIQHDRASL